MFMLCCTLGEDTELRNHPKETGKSGSLQGRPVAWRKGLKVVDLHISMMGQPSRAGLESIPDNELFLVGLSSPLFLKVTTKTRKASFGNGSADSNNLTCEQLLLSIMLSVVRCDTIILNVGFDHSDLIDQLCDRCKMMVWTPQGGNSMRCSPTPKLDNLKISKSFDSFNKFDTLGLFDEFGKRLEFTLNPRTKTIDYFMLSFYDKNENKSKNRLLSLYSFKVDSKEPVELREELHIQGHKVNRSIMSRIYIFEF